jgi:8-oxo-dGTP diphosphatase
MPKLLLVAAAALVDVDGRVLICQRPPGKQLAGLWEFPGGKLEEGETPEACLIRELNEELGIEVAEACLAPFVFASHTYEGHNYESFHLMMPLYLCRRWKGVVVAKEHSALAWVKPDKLGDYPMPPADAPLVAWLRDWL